MYNPTLLYDYSRMQDAYKNTTSSSISDRSVGILSGQYAQEMINQAQEIYNSHTTEILIGVGVIVGIAVLLAIILRLKERPKKKSKPAPEPQYTQPQSVPEQNLQPQFESVNFDGK